MAILNDKLKGANVRLLLPSRTEAVHIRISNLQEVWEQGEKMKVN